MLVHPEYAGLAALSICEALLLAIKERGVLPEHEITGILSDAAATHQNVLGSTADEAAHRAVAKLISRIAADNAS